jgi:hypothetical protein
MAAREDGHSSENILIDANKAEDKLLAVRQEKRY